MYIVFKTSVAGARFDYAEGDQVELSNDIAMDFIRQGFARPAGAEDLGELAVKAQPETAAKRIVRRVRRGIGLPG